MTAQWFENSVKPANVESQLRAHVPELSDGGLDLKHCRVTRIRSVPLSGSWTATYELGLHDNKTGLDWTFATTGLLTPPDLPMPVSIASTPFGSEGWNQTFPELRLQLHGVPSGARLPGLDVITDPQKSCILLGRILAAGSPLPISSCAATIASHKPEVRATVICELGYEGGRPSTGWPDTVVVKVHHDDEGARAHEALLALNASALGASDALRLARPLAYVPELRMSVQEHIDHQSSLKDLFTVALERESPDDWDELTTAMRATAAGLAALHLSGSAHGETVTFDDELTIVRDKYTKLAAVVPELQDRLGPAIERIEAASRRTPADALGQVHHSFRPAQVLLNGHVAFIDFDKACQSEPGSDIASLTTKLLHMGVNKIATTELLGERVAKLMALRTHFLAEYERNAPLSTDRLAIWEAYELVSLVLSAAKKMDPARIDNCCRLLEQHLRTHDI